MANLTPQLFTRISAALATALLAVFFLAAGCATIFSTSQYPVAFNSNPEGIKFKVVNEDGFTVNQGTTPTTIILDASACPFNLEFENGVVTALGCQVDGWTWGNALIGIGTFGVGTLAASALDGASGAAWSLPSTVFIDFDELSNPSQKESN